MSLNDKKLQAIRDAARKDAVKDTEDIKQKMVIQERKNLLTPDQMDEITESFEKKGYSEKRVKRIVEVGKFLQSKTMTSALTGTSAGGAAIPDDFRREIIDRVEGFGNVFSVTRNIPTSSGSVDLAVGNTDSSAAWVGENATISKSDPALRQLKLNPHKLGAITYLSNELVADSATIPAITDWALNKLATDIARKLNNAIVSGSGSGQPTGLQQYVRAKTDTTTAARAVKMDPVSLAASTPAARGIVADNLIEVVYTLDSGYREGAIWIMKDQDAALLRKVKSTGNAEWTNAVTQGNNLMAPAVQGILLGYPVITVPNSWISGTLTTGFASIADSKGSAIFFGNPDYYAVAVRNNLAVTITTEGGTAFENDTTGIRVTARFDGNLAQYKSWVSGLYQQS